MNKGKSVIGGRIRKSEHIFAVKVKTESNGLGVLKTLLVLGLIGLQATILILTYSYFLQLFSCYIILSVIIGFILLSFLLPLIGIMASIG